jgi:hypothetical protein
MVQISEYSGSDPVVRNFFFSASVNFVGELKFTDKVLLAVEESVIVGGVIFRNEKRVFVYAKPEGLRALIEESQKIKC